MNKIYFNLKRQGALFEKTAPWTPAKTFIKPGYSYRNASTGFAAAVFIAWKPTVARVNNTVTTPDAKKTQK